MGALVSRVLGASRRHPLIVDVCVGMLGAAFVGGLASPFLGAPLLNEGRFGLGAAIVPAVGAALIVVMKRAMQRDGA